MTFSRAVELAPQEPLGLRGRGATEVRLGQPAAALADLKRAETLEPGNAQTRFWQGLACHAMGRDREAITALEQAACAFGSDRRRSAAAHYQRGLIYQELGETATAITAFTQALTHERRLAPAYYQRGWRQLPSSVSRLRSPTWDVPCGLRRSWPTHLLPERR